MTSSLKNISVSVVLPAHNEAPNIESTVGQCIAVCSKLFNEFEIIVVDDGSSDTTGAMVDKMAGAEGRIKLITHPSNRGYGAALRSGFEAASKQWIFFTDSDGQFDVAEMADFVTLLDKADIVAGFRIKRRDNLYRRMMGTVYTALMDLFFGVAVKDVNCAFKFIRADFIKSVTLSSEGALINSEMLALARRRNLIIMQKGVHHYPRKVGKQSGGSPHVIIKAVREFVNLYKALGLSDDRP